MADLNRALFLGIACGGLLVLLTSRTRRALGRRSPFVFYVAATLAFAVLACGPLIIVSGADHPRSGALRVAALGARVRSSARTDAFVDARHALPVDRRRPGVPLAGRRRPPGPRDRVRRGGWLPAARRMGDAVSDGRRPGALAESGAARSDASDPRAATRAGVGRSRNVSRDLAPASRPERRQRLRSAALRAAPGRAQRARSRHARRARISRRAGRRRGWRIRSRRRVGPVCLGGCRRRGRGHATACAPPTGFRRAGHSNLRWARRSRLWPSRRSGTMPASYQMDGSKPSGGTILSARRSGYAPTLARCARSAALPMRSANTRGIFRGCWRSICRSTDRSGKRSGVGRPRRSRSSPPRARPARRPCTSPSPRAPHGLSACASSRSTRTCGGWRN